ncbi:hypothetical protein FGO68_gene13989 [Halteria grandinella]|uniref:Uncharacterized protein n=1 Tax=Halteria grandinella TaxID=5974 RepID=A0A8J8NPG3_HALGN|nr:hypothetical protein FGO68_gene13989 [Halteria grandinella]
MTGLSLIFMILIQYHQLYMASCLTNSPQFMLRVITILSKNPKSMGRLWCSHSTIQIQVRQRTAHNL